MTKRYRNMAAGRYVTLLPLVIYKFWNGNEFNF